MSEHDDVPTARIEDVTNMCRVCMDDLQGELVSIFQRVREDTIACMIIACGNVDVSENDNLPKQCCERCIEGMYIAYFMRKQCRESDIRLRQIFNVTDPDTINEYDPTFETVTVEEEEECVNFLEQENGVDNEDTSDNSTYSDSDSSESQKEDDEKKEESEADEPFDIESRSSDHEESTKYVAQSNLRKGKRCCSCRHDFDTNDLLIEHSNKVHLPDKFTDTSKKFECDLCYKRYYKKTSLNRHIRSTFSNIRARYKKIIGTRCCGCKDDFDSEELLLEHCENVHGPDRTQDESKPYECELCYKRYITKNSLHRHRRKKYTNNTRSRVCRKLNVNRCCGCREDFKTKEALAKHSESIHLPERTEAGSSDSKPIECDVCYNRYSSKRSLLRHKSRIYLERIYQCMQCEKSFIRRSNLNSHEKKVHFGVKRSSLLSGIYQCVHCGKTFMQQSTLNNHEKTHLENKTIVCSICSKRFSSKGNLQTHMKLHSVTTESHNCHTCGKAFKKAELLKSHAQSHLKEKKYECSICNTKFKTANYLDIHARIHTGEKPFQCSNCQKTFAHSSGYRRHLLTHTGLKPFICKYCDKDFASRPNMLIHEKLHTGEKNSACDICGKQFVHSRYMKSHRRLHFNTKNGGSLPHMSNIANLPHFNP